MPPILLLLAVAAFVVVIASAMNKAPLWVGVLLLTVFAMLQAGLSLR